MNKLLTINNVRGYANEDGTVYINLEDTARGLGFTRVAESGNEVVRWDRIKAYLIDIKFMPTSGYEELPEFIPENIFYRLAMKARNEVADKFQTIVCDEILPTIRKTGSYTAKVEVKEPSQFDKDMLAVKYVAEFLRVSETGRIKMMGTILNHHHVPIGILPVYVDEEVTKALTVLLKEHGVATSATKFNDELIKLGLLETKSRNSSKGEVKNFKSITAQGEVYGKNLICASNQKETQPHYYISKFAELIKLVQGR